MTPSRNRQPANLSRRRLLQQLSALPVAGGLSLPFGRSPARATADTGRSLVCIFLVGGADSLSMIVPGGALHADYRAARRELAVPETSLIEVSDAARGAFGFNDRLPSLASLYRQSRLAVVANTGPLIRPTTRADYVAARALPFALFAHLTQQNLWQTGVGIAGGNPSLGLGGAITDAAALRDTPLPPMHYDSRNPLAAQLHQATRLIAARECLGMKRQYLTVRMGGWDTHTDQNERLPPLLDALDDAIGAFQATVDDLGLAASVTGFTASEFGRTLGSIGNGTDHGWGGHHFVFGGTVDGGRIVGQMPGYAMQGACDEAIRADSGQGVTVHGDTGQGDSSSAGCLIPSQSVAQYGATLMRWMGIPAPELAQALPELANFPTPDLGFMPG